MTAGVRRAALVACCALAALAGGVPAAAAPQPVTARHVVIVGVAGLRWTDVTPERTPALARLARTGSVGSLSVRAAPSPPDVTCPGEGWLTLGAGTYAALHDPAGIDPDRGCGPRQPPPVEVDGEGARVPTVPALDRLNRGLRFGARPGRLGDSLRCTAAIGPGAALAVADRAGRVGVYAPALPTEPGPALGQLLERCPLTAVDLGALPPAGRDEPGRAARQRAVAAADAALARVDADRPAGSVLVVLGVGAGADRKPHLHVAAVTGEGFRGGWLRSPSTRRTPYVQLCDVAPTALHLLGRPVPADLAGRPLTGSGPRRPADPADARATLIDTDAAATAQRAVAGAFFVGLGALMLLVFATLGWLLRRHRRGAAVSPVVLRGLGVAAVALTAVPGATFVANLAPWWRASWPGASWPGASWPGASWPGASWPGASWLALGGTVAAAVAVAVAVSYAGPWRRQVAGPVVVTAALTVLVFALDALTGTGLQLDSMLGYNPLVAGRFTGFGNIAFAVLGAAAMLLAAFLAMPGPHGDAGPARRRAALAAVAAVAVPVIALDGLPAWGADVGGVLTLIPAFAVLGLLVTSGRVNSWRLLWRLAWAATAAVAVVAAIGILDYQRPAGAQSHFGRFIAAIVDGSAGGALRRKALANLHVLLAGPHTIAALVLAVLASIWVFRPPPTLRRAYAAVPALRTALVSVLAVGWIGFAVNDSGVAVPVVAGLVAAPAALAVCARVAGAAGRLEASPRLSGRRPAPVAGRGPC